LNHPYFDDLDKSQFNLYWGSLPQFIYL
jgi:hypothetical protein